MNPLLNPLFLGRVLQSYLSVPNRLRKMSDEDLQKNQMRALKRIVRYAYRVPLYHDKYRKHNVHPRDIKHISDIEKLPFVTKDEMRENFPYNVIPPEFNSRSAVTAATSGSTGRALSLYLDFYTVLHSMLGFVRALEEHNINWRKNRISLLIDLTENSFESEYFVNSIFSFLQPVISLENIQILDLLSPPQDNLHKMQDFKPDVIIGYPFAIIQLAQLKNKRLGTKVNPSYIGTTGAFFDEFSRRFVEETFGVKMFDMYAATEAGPIAFECKHHTYHVCSDFVHLEYFQNGETVAPGQPGSIVVTKLYGAGTPIIRYTGLTDVVTPSINECSCDLSGDIIKQIHGRKDDAIILPDGRMAMLSVFENIIGRVLYEQRIDTVKRFQIIQHDLNRIEIKTLFYPTSKNTDCQQAFMSITNRLTKKLGENIEIFMTKTDGLDSTEPYVKSKFNKKKIAEESYVV